jgi:hypothetical protein
MTMQTPCNEVQMLDNNDAVFAIDTAMQMDKGAIAVHALASHPRSHFKRRGAD